MAARHTSGRTDPDAAARLKQARESAGKTQAEVARALLVSTETITNWENARSEPRLSDLKTLCSIYRVTPGYLIGEAAA